MKLSASLKLIPLLLALIGIITLYCWLDTDLATDLQPRLPIKQNLGRQVSADQSSPAERGWLERFDGVPAKIPGVWPRFRGPNFDAVSREQLPLARSWPEAGPEVLWSIELGEGYAGPAVLDGCVYLLDYDQQKNADAVRCLSLADGKEIWRYSYPVKIKRNHGMSRTVPAVTQKYIVTLGPKCHLACLDTKTGRLLWMFDLVRQFGAKVPPWYAGQCPLIDDEKAIIAVGGDCLMMAVDCNSGQILWKSPNPHRWTMTHSSIVPVEFAGHRMYVYCASGGVVGVSATDGSILWETTAWKIRIANVPTPVVVGPGLIFFSGGYNAGSMLLKLQQQDQRITPSIQFRLSAEVFGAPQHTPIFYEGYIYGVRQDGQLVCLDLSGKIKWTSSSAHKFGLGPYIIADGLIFLMNDSGVLTLAEASPDAYKQLAQAKVLPGPDAWGPMAMVGGRLLVRDLKKMVCLDVARK